MPHTAGVSKIKARWPHPDDFLDRSARTKRNQNLEDAIGAQDAAISAALDEVVFHETDRVTRKDKIGERRFRALKALVRETRNRIFAEQVVGMPGDDERAELEKMANRLIANPAKRYELTKHHTHGTIFKMPPKDERLLNPSGATARVLTCSAGGLRAEYPLPFSYYWCVDIIESGDDLRWVEVPLADYLNPANWHAPPTEPRS